MSVRRIQYCIWGILTLTLSGGDTLFAQTSPGQNNLLFYQLNTSHGLSDNYIRDMAIDSSGNLWVATGDGLNMFNGKTVVKFFRNAYPQITHDDIRQVVCDSANRIWILTYDRNVAVIDEERRFHLVSLRDSTGRIPVRRILDPQDAGLILFVRGGHYRLRAGTEVTKLDSLTRDHFTEILISGFDTLHQHGFRQVEKFDERHYLYVLQDRFFLVDYLDRNVEQEYPIPDVFELTQWNRESVLVQDLKTLQLKVIDLQFGSVSTFPFDTLTDQYGKPVADVVTNAKKVRRDELLLTTRKSGIYIYDFTTGKLFNHRHHAADPGTIINNAPTVIAADHTGWVFWARHRMA